MVRAASPRSPRLIFGERLFSTALAAYSRTSPRPFTDPFPSFVDRVRSRLRWLGSFPASLTWRIAKTAPVVREIIDPAVGASDTIADSIAVIVMASPSGRDPHHRRRQVSVAG
jgi:hypothetical protein